MFGNTKGQVTILTLFVAVILLILYVAFLPMINTAINESMPHLTNSPMAAALVALFPFFLIVGIIMSVFSYLRRGGEGYF